MHRHGYIRHDNPLLLWIPWPQLASVVLQERYEFKPLLSQKLIPPEPWYVGVVCGLVAGVIVCLAFSQYHGSGGGPLSSLLSFPVETMWGNRHEEGGSVLVDAVKSCGNAMHTRTQQNWGSSLSLCTCMIARRCRSWDFLKGLNPLFARANPHSVTSLSNHIFAFSWHWAKPMLMKSTHIFDKHIDR